MKALVIIEIRAVCPHCYVELMTERHILPPNGDYLLRRSGEECNVQCYSCKELFNYISMSAEPVAGDKDNKNNIHTKE